MRYSPTILSLLTAWVLLFATFNSCNEAITNPTDEMSVKDFPNEIGNNWKYFYYDSLTSTSDTVSVYITGDTIFSGSRIAKIWQYKFKDKTEYRFVETKGDTVRIYSDLNSLWINTKYVFPIKVGNTWQGDFVNDSSSTIAKHAITVPAGSFKDCYSIRELWDGFNDYGEINTWLVPGIGMVMMQKKEGTMIFFKNYWELLQYKKIN